MGKRPVIKNRNELANIIAKLTTNKREAHVSAIRSAMRELIEFDEAATLAGRKSPLVALRKEVLARPKVKAYMQGKTKALKK